VDVAGEPCSDRPEAHAPLLFARRLALVYGIGLPLVETVRRWEAMTSGAGFWWPGLLDDYVIGALLLAALWRWRGDASAGRRWLAAAWGVTSGMGYYSFFGNLREIETPDPLGFDRTVTLAVIGVGWLLAIVALAQVVRAGAAGATRR
jgi:hypothetical protein